MLAAAGVLGLSACGGETDTAPETAAENPAAASHACNPLPITGLWSEKHHSGSSQTLAKTPAESGKSK